MSYDRDRIFPSTLSARKAAGRRAHLPSVTDRDRPEVGQASSAKFRQMAELWSCGPAANSQAPRPGDQGRRGGDPGRCIEPLDQPRGDQAGEATKPTAYRGIAPITRPLYPFHPSSWAWNSWCLKRQSGSAGQIPRPRPRQRPPAGDRPRAGLYTTLAQTARRRRQLRPRARFSAVAF